MTAVIASITNGVQAGHMDQSLLQHLRQATRPYHQQIEQNDCLARLLAPDFSMAEYKNLLARMLGFFQPVEEAIDALPEAPSIQETLGCRHKTSWLMSDLRNLGLCEEAIARIPRISAPDIPVVATLADAVGILYVLEGSTLGGQIISRYLSQSLGVGPEQGGRFYAGYGAENGRMWTLFRQWLASLSLDNTQTEQAATAAIQAFKSLDNWLSQGTISNV